MKSDVTPDTCDTDPKIPDSNITIVAGCKYMTIYSVPLNLWGTNYNKNKNKILINIKAVIEGLKL